MEDSRDAQKVVAAFKSRLTEASPLLKVGAPDDVSSLDFMVSSVTREFGGSPRAVEAADSFELWRSPRRSESEVAIGLHSTALDTRFDPKGSDQVVPAERHDFDLRKYHPSSPEFGEPPSSPTRNVLDASEETILAHRLERDSRRM
ncbi:hypothetical protein GGX14DRAFT_570583 [Mycena pura]|uniref:Uncharacterized protein n=1 Tax=Mycena pura TaxID=153505 RepID=A0AAD6V7D2_9AGAR|nr:hypothetical protein GGX14DRAFT_570583 [Mycena pura]